MIRLTLCKKINNIYIYLTGNQKRCVLIEEGSLILFFYNGDKKWLLRVEKEKKLHTHLGIIDVGATIGLKYGASIYTNKDNIFIEIMENTYLNYSELARKELERIEGNHRSKRILQDLTNLSSFS